MIFIMLKSHIFANSKITSFSDYKSPFTKTFSDYQSIHCRRLHDLVTDSQQPLPCLLASKPDSPQYILHGALLIDVTGRVGAQGP